MAAVSGSRRCFSIFWEDADSRRAADGFRIRLGAVDLEGIYLEGPGSESAVCCTEVGRVTGGGG